MIPMIFVIPIFGMRYMYSSWYNLNKLCLFLDFAIKALVFNLHAEWVQSNGVKKNGYSG